MNKASQPYISNSDFNGSSYWMNYHIKVIRRKHVLTQEENSLILKSRFKYILISGLGAIGFLITMKYYYKYSLRIDYFSYKSTSIETLCYYAFGLSSLLISYRFAERSYCNNLKFLVMKYGEIEEDKYKEFMENKSILKSFYKEK
jgi:hypothetical protein